MADIIHPSDIDIPATFEGITSLIFEREIRLTPIDAANHRVFLQFMGLNYSVEISLNNMVINKHLISLGDDYEAAILKYE